MNQSAEQSTKVRMRRINGKLVPAPTPKAKPEGYDLIVRPKTEEEFKYLADELYAWAQLPTSNDINAFPISKKISPYRFKRLPNEYFQEMLELAKYMISSRNRTGVITKEFEKELYFKELYLLDLDYKEAEDDKIAKRVKGIKQAMGNVQLIDHMMDE